MACTSCGFDNPVGNRFCGGCGTRLDDANFGMATVAAERRLVTVLFVDLVGFTSFSERHDSEDVRAMLARYFDLARAAIARHGGVVDKLMGDGVMAVWGARTAREDDAEQAVLAALEMMDGVASISRGLAARAGVNTGEAAVDMGGEDAGMVIGDLVNTAARLESAAMPGTVLVGAGTYRAAGARIDFDDGGVRQLKGKGAAVHTWVALGPRRAGEVDVQAPFLGRDDLMVRLLHAVDRQEGGASLCCVWGPAGVGKSRLVGELERAVVRERDATVLRGRSTGGVLAAFAEMCRALAGVAPGDTDDGVRRSVEQVLARVVADPMERSWVQPAVLRLLDVEQGRVAPAELFSRLRLLLERLAEHRPLVLLLDDAHAADETTLDFVDHLVEWVRGQTVVVVAIARPELFARRSGWASLGPAIDHVAVEPLGADVIATMVATLVPDLPESVAGDIVRRCEGVPLYALEMVRMLAADGRIARAGDKYRVTSEIADVRIPESLTALVAARLDALSAAGRRVALDASVLGDRFHTAALGAVCHIDHERQMVALAELVDAVIIAPDVDSPTGARSFRFVQGLVQEIAYNTLARMDRRARHHAAARYFAAVGHQEATASMATHDLAAYRCAVTADDAAAYAQRALASIRSAIEPAWQLGGFSQVVVLADAALDIATLPDERADMQRRRAEAAIELGDYVEALGLLEQVHTHHRHAGDSAEVARAASALGETLLRLARPGEARVLLEDALADHAHSAEPDRIGSLQVLLARCMDFEGQSADGFRLADSVASMGERMGDDGLRADALVAKGTCCGRIGRVDDGVAALEEGIRLAEASGSHSVRLRGLTNLAWLLKDHDPRRTHALAVEGCSFARRVGAASMERFMAAFRMGVALDLGEWDDAAVALQLVNLDVLQGSDLGAVLTSAVAVRAARGKETASLMSRLEAMGSVVQPSWHATWTGEATYYVADADGRWADAAAAAWSAAEAADGLSPELWLYAARAALRLGDAGQAAAAADRFDAPPSASLDSVLFALRACIGYGLGQADASHGDVATSRNRLLALGLQWPAAQVAIDAAVAWGTSEPGVRDGLVDARAFLDKVEGHPYVGVVDRYLANVS